jgi:ketopantoate reductase
MQMKWRKLIVNSSINSLTALLKVKNGQLQTVSNLHIANIVRGLTKEIIEVAQASGIKVMIYNLE